MEPTFKPKGQPLTPQEWEELGKIKVSDLRAAIATAEPNLQKFLKAKR